MAARTHAVPLDDAALAWLALALVPELPPRRAFALVERFGTPRAVLEAPAGALAAADAPPAVVTAIAQAPGPARGRRPDGRGLRHRHRPRLSELAWRAGGRHRGAGRPGERVPLRRAAAPVPLPAPQPDHQRAHARHRRGRGRRAERLAHHRR